MAKKKEVIIKSKANVKNKKNEKILKSTNKVETVRSKRVKAPIVKKLVTNSKQKPKIKKESKITAKKVVKSQNLKKKEVVQKKTPKTKEKTTKPKLKKNNDSNIVESTTNNVTSNTENKDPDAPEILDLTKFKLNSSEPINLKVNEILLKCVKVGSKLRVRIVTRGYYNDANCQFPKNIRVEGRMYKVNVREVVLASGSSGKYFYRINHGITILKDNELQLSLTSIKVFEDKTDSDCAVCLCAPKTTVIIPCGHFYTCMDCAKKLENCPICRGNIAKLIDKTNMD